MPTIKGKDGKSHFAMNPQAGKAAFGGDVDPAPPGLGALGGPPPPGAGQPGQDPLAAAGGAPPVDPGMGGDTHVEVHHGGHPDGNPPPTEMTQYHTITADATGAPMEIQNHDDISTVDQSVKAAMGAVGPEDMDGGEPFAGTDTANIGGESEGISGY